MKNNLLPEVIDLFSGCGGLAIGFEKVGFNITHGIEIMEDAAKNASYNLDWRYGKTTSHICGDITKLEPSLFKNKIGNNGCIVIGGPPCQAYSTAGKGKLRSLGDNRININDARGYLYQDFLKFTFGLDARVVIMENVPESVNFGGINIPQIVCEELEKRGYNSVWTILNAADYGVPQIRERVFVLAIKDTEKKNLYLPKPTHSNHFDKKTIVERRMNNYKSYSNFKMPLKGTKELPSWVTVEEAISDLPTLFPSVSSKYKLYPLNIELKYCSEPKNRYQEFMRDWYGYRTTSVSANAYRNNKRDFPLFDLMKQGDDFTNASNIADRLLSFTLKINNISKDTDEEIYEKFKNEIVPCYNREKFPGKWKKLSLNKPSHTVVAHLQKDTYSHIHPVEPRGISVREAARLQSFPDDYFFNCTMGEAFKQIGNAVPPLLAKGIAEAIKKCF